MLPFRWVLGDMTDNSPEEILALLADLANVDEEHVNELFSPEPMAQGPGSARWRGKDVCGVGAARTGAARLVLPRTFQHHHADPGQSGGLPGEKGSMLTLRVMVVSVLASSPTGGSPSRTWRGDSPSISHRERRSVGPDRHDGSGGRARGGVGGAPGAVRGGVVSKSATKAFRDGIGREKKCGIPTFLLLRSGSVGVFVADLDNRRRQ